MRRTNPFAAAVLGAVVALIAVIALPGLGIGETTTSHGLTPSDVYSTNGPPGGEICGVVDTFGVAPVLPTRVTVAVPSNLLVYFTSEWSGLEASTELLLNFQVHDDAGNPVASTGCGQRSSPSRQRNVDVVIRRRRPWRLRRLRGRTHRSGAWGARRRKHQQQPDGSAGELRADGVREPRGVGSG